jgi:tetratricopeptide (TPR) repeat protein
LSEAQHGYQNVLHQHPNHPPALHFLGVVALTVGNFLDAVDLISKAILYDPDYAAAHSNLGNAYQSQGKSEEAIECYNNAISINPEYAIRNYPTGNR